jgi:hypothetical protein
MFNLFKKNNSFPLETEPGNVYIKDDQLFYEDHTNEEIVDLSKLKYAYIEILGDRPFLFLFDYYQHYILITQKGFSETYPLLSKRFGFDDALFFKTVNSKKEQKHRIWIKEQTKNYEILTTAHNDFPKGFEVLSQPSKFISWDTTYHEFPTLNIGHIYSSEFGINYFRIDYPVRIGSMIIKDLEFHYDNNQKNIAVQSYFTSLYNNANTDDSYKEIRDFWMKEIPTDLDEAGYERADQNYLRFNMNDIHLTLTYTYDAEHSYDDGSTTLGIDNFRDYTDILLQPRNDLKSETTKIIKFKSGMNFLPRYQENSKVTTIPNLIQQVAEHHQALWLDIDNQKFGFTGDQHAIEYELFNVDYITIQNVLPAKGAGYVELRVQPKLGHSEGIYYGELNSLDEYAMQMEQLLGIKVEMPEPYYNC